MTILCPNEFYLGGFTSGYLKSNKDYQAIRINHFT